MQMKKILFFVAFYLFLADTSFAQSYSKTETESRCNSLGNEIGAAIYGRDFKGLKMVANWGIKNCKNYIDRDTYYEQYGSLALAERSLTNFAAAMKATDECIKNRYGITVCHAETAAIYIDLGDYKNAISSAKTTKLIATSKIEEAKRALRNGYISSSEKELLESRINLNESVLVFINDLLKNHDQ